MATGKTIPLTRRIFVGKIMSLLLKMLSRLVIAFLPRTKWLYLGGSKITVDFTFTFHFHALEKEMATHSSVLAWRIPGTEEPGGLPSMGSHRVGHDWSNLAAAAAKSLQMVTAAMKLKDAYSLEGKSTNLDSILKSRDIILPTKIHLVKAMIFPVVMQDVRVGL